MSPFDVDSALFAITMPGGGELLLILLIVLVVFGHNRIPQLGEALGKGIKNFRKSFAKDETEIEPEQAQVQVQASEVQSLPKQSAKVVEAEQVHVVTQDESATT